MYIFEAHYINSSNGEEFVREIEFNGDNFFSTEKECYLYAMGKAYDMKKDNEWLLTVVFIAC